MIHSLWDAHTASSSSPSSMMVTTTTTTMTTPSLNVATTAKEMASIDAALQYLLLAPEPVERDAILYCHGGATPPFDDREVYCSATGFDRALGTVKEALAPAASELIASLAASSGRGGGGSGEGGGGGGSVHAHHAHHAHHASGGIETSWLGQMKGDRRKLLAFVEPMVRAVATGRRAGMVERMRLNLVLRSFTSVWQCLNDLVNHELRHAVGSTSAQIAWERLTRDFFNSSGAGGDEPWGVRRRAVHRSEASLLSEFRLRLADGAMGVVATVASAVDAERKQLRAVNERVHQQSLELAAEKRAHAEAREFIHSFLGEGNTHTKDRIVRLDEALAAALDDKAALERANKTLEDSVARLTISGGEGVEGGDGEGEDPSPMREEARRAYELKIATLAAALAAAERSRDTALARAEHLHREGVELRREVAATRVASSAAAAAADGTRSSAGARGRADKLV